MVDGSLLLNEGVLAAAEVETVAVFGSYARGTMRTESDLDVLVLCERPERRDEVIRAVESSCRWPIRPEISHYTREGLTRLLSPPSLFAWHLRLESVVLYDRYLWFQEKLSPLGPFRDHLADLAVLRSALDDAVSSLERSQLSLNFDAGVLATVARNTALLLSHAEGTVDFGPESPLKLRNHTAVPFPLAEMTFRLLLAARRAAERGRPAPTLDHGTVIGAALCLRSWIEDVRAYLISRFGENP